VIIGYSSGGMEYPMITLITSPDAKVESLDAVIVHEVGHNWFMGMLGSNERDHAWMDEGLNTYYQLRYEANKYRSCSIFGDAIPPEVKKLSAVEFMKLVYKVIDDALPMEAAMDKTSSEFVSSDEYGLIVYVKTAYWMSLLEEKYGRAKVDAALKNYFNKWKHKHPQPEDMQKSFEEVIGKDLTKFFELTAKTGKLTF
jgi:aminopeptidase N